MEVNFKDQMDNRLLYLATPIITLHKSFFKAQMVLKFHGCVLPISNTLLKSAYAG